MKEFQMKSQEQRVWFALLDHYWTCRASTEPFIVTLAVVTCQLMPSHPLLASCVPQHTPHRWTARPWDSGDKVIPVRGYNNAEHNTHQVAWDTVGLSCENEPINGIYSHERSYSALVQQPAHTALLHTNSSSSQQFHVLLVESIQAKCH